MVPQIGFLEDVLLRLPDWVELHQPIHQAILTEVLAEVEQRSRWIWEVSAEAEVVIPEAMGGLIILVTSLDKAAVPTTGTPKDFLRPDIAMATAQS